MLRKPATRRFFLFFLPALLFLLIPLIACGGSGTAVPACENLTTSEECNTCCTGEGYIGHVYNSFSTPACKCM